MGSTTHHPIRVWPAIDSGNDGALAFSFLALLNLSQLTPLPALGLACNDKCRGHSHDRGDAGDIYRRRKAAVEHGQNEGGRSFNVHYLRNIPSTVQTVS